MAQRVDVILVDDLTGEDADESLSFALDGVEYEIDLSEDNAEELREALSAYIEAGRRVGGRKIAKRAKSDQGGPSASDIRAWARENGWDMPVRGRVPAEVRKAYAAAH